MTTVGRMSRQAVQMQGSRSMAKTTWNGPVQELIDRSPNSMPALWSLLATACVGSAALSAVPPLDDDLPLTRATRDLREAMGELEWVRPHLPVQGVVVDMGQAPPDDVMGCRAAIAALIAKALRLMASLLDDPATSTGELMSLTRVLDLVSQVRARVAARSG